MKAYRFFLCFFCGLCLLRVGLFPSFLWAHTDSLPRYSLAEVESRFTAGIAAYAQAEAAASEASALEEQIFMRSGPRLYAAGDIGETLESRRGGQEHFSTSSIRVGVQMPVLATLADQKRAQLRAAYARAETLRGMDTLWWKNLAILRQAYILYWSAGQRLHLAEGYLQREKKQSAMLAAREKSGRVLPSDVRELATSFELARREARKAQNEQAIALRQLQDLSTLQTGFIPVRPELRTPSQPIESSSWIAESSGVRAAASALQAARAEGELINGELSGNLDAYIAAGYDDNEPLREYRAGVSLRLDIPLRALERGPSPTRKAHIARVKKLEHALALAQKQAQEKIASSFAAYDLALTNMHFAQGRVQAAKRRVLERTARKVLEGDALEQLLQARFTLYKTEVDLVNAQTQYLLRTLEALRFSSKKPQNIPAGRGFYVWDASTFLREAKILNFWDKLAASGVSRILLSFTAVELQQLYHPGPAKSLIALLQQASESGICVEFLLGEPLWILPEYRNELLEILEKFQKIPFTAVHLDIEPDQLDISYWKNYEILQEFQKTLKAVVKKSVWPVEISIHPRYILPESRKNMAEFFQKSGISCVIIMTYVSTQEKIIDILRKVRTQIDIPLGIALSVENSLGQKNSLHSYGRQGVEKYLGELQFRSQIYTQRDILLQNWTQWRQMKQ